MKKKTMKAIKDLNAYIDDDRQKLCDKLHDIELSHKRMERLLKRSKQLLAFSMANFVMPESVYVDFMDLVCFIDRELSYPYFRVNYRVKGEKK